MNRTLGMHRILGRTLVGAFGICLWLASAGMAQAAGTQALPAWATHAPEIAARPSLVEIDLVPGLDEGALERAGLDIGDVHGSTANVLIWPGDEERLARLGITARLIDTDPGRTAARRAERELAVRRGAPTGVRSAARADGIFRTESLPPFGSGSMGGYWTGAEIKMKLDQLVSSDAHDLVADKVDTVGFSREGRPIWGLRIAKKVAGPDTRPVVYLNALIHAREPESMQAIFYFIDDLIAKYGSDAFATWLLQNRVIYIVPLDNPDGYAVNEATYNFHHSFGLWRKNTRDNNHNGVFDSTGTVDGVDLNRNFGVNWGINDTGSSPDSSSDIYRGPGPFSEAETQVQRDLVTALKPVSGFSLHTYYDLMIHPWGPNTVPTPDSAAFNEWSDAFTRDNGFLSGPPARILYDVNGDYNDWCYGDTLAKPRAFTWTPEIGAPDDGGPGGTGFWPLPSRIVPLSQEMLRPCYLVTAIAGPYVVADGVTIVEGAMNAGRLTNLVIGARNQGAKGSAGPGLTGTLVALDAGAHVLNGTLGYPTATPLTTVQPNGGMGFQVTLDDSVTPGRLMRFEVDFTVNNAFGRDTVVVPAGTPTVLFADGASSGTTSWTISPSGSWSVVTNDPSHPNRYFGEGGLGNYSVVANDKFIMKLRLNLAAGVHAYAFYDAKWEYEQDYDGGAIEAAVPADSSTSSKWAQLPATGTNIAGSVTGTAQPVGHPIYRGSRRLWKSEIADLSSFAGRTQVDLRFHGFADGGTQFDGLAIDSLRVVIYDPAAQPAVTAVGDGLAPSALAFAAPHPNPAHGFARFEFALPRAAKVRLEILDVQGRRVRTLFDGPLAAGHYVRGWDLKDTGGAAIPPGLYLARLRGAGASLVRRVVVL